MFEKKVKTERKINTHRQIYLSSYSIHTFINTYYYIFFYIFVIIDKYEELCYYYFRGNTKQSSSSHWYTNRRISYWTGFLFRNVMLFCLLINNLNYVSLFFFVVFSFCFLYGERGSSHGKRTSPAISKQKNKALTVLKMKQD